MASLSHRHEQFKISSDYYNDYCYEQWRKLVGANVAIAPPENHKNIYYILTYNFYFQKYTFVL